MAPRKNRSALLANLRRKARQQGVKIRSMIGPSPSSFIHLIRPEWKEWKRETVALANAGHSWSVEQIRKARPKKKTAYLVAYRALLLRGVDFAGDTISMSGEMRNQLKESYEWIMRLGPGNPLREYHLRNVNNILRGVSPIARQLFRVQLMRHSEAAKKWVRKMDRQLLYHAVRNRSRRV